jgi:dTMP kinase
LRRGAFITIEGSEGVGKSSSLSAVEDAIRALGWETVVTREPGGTPLGERIREWVLGSPRGSLSAEVEALLMFAARAEHLDQVIRPALAAGRWVVCDRFSDATFAYQGAGRGASAQFLTELATRVQRGLEPDLTLLLDAPADVGLARISHREHDHFEQEGLAFFERIRDAYLAIAAGAPARVKIIDASLPIEDVRREAERIVAEFGDRFDPQ